MPYNTATICLNGHIVSKYRANSQKFCSKCGEKTFSFCPHCNAPIKGAYYSSGVIISDRPLPLAYYCDNCGLPYPWTQKILDNAVELLSLDESLSLESKELIKTAIPELIIDTPTTPIAIAKYKKGITKAGQVVKDAMRQLLLDVVCEIAKNSLFP